MYLILIAMEILLAGGVGALLAGRHRKLARALGCGAAILGCAVGLSGVMQLLVGGQEVEMASLPCSLPGCTFILRADALTGFFLAPVFALGALGALFGGQHLWAWRERKPMGRPWFFYNLLIIGMALVLLARNAVFFLIAWELMTLASFFLVVFEDEREAVQRAGWLYLVAGHLGVGALFVMFILLGHGSGSLDFMDFAARAATLSPAQASLLFVLALLGFGAKAGLLPLHVWLPEAYPAAPGFVSGLMSGAMSKLGVYGFIRLLTWLPPAQAWWGWLIITLGALSGLGGILFALAQHDLKRLLAYSSVENMGIIFMGLGLGLLGQSIAPQTAAAQALQALGFGAALLHVLNHSMFKGLLFMGSASVLHGARTLEIDQAGGLLRRMPWTGACFIIGSVAICGLPPFNGFASEFMLYSGAFKCLQALSLWNATAALILIAALALIGGLAAACFAKAVGAVFLGEPRSPQAAAAHETGGAMRTALALPALACLLIGLLAPAVVHFIQPAIAIASGLVLDDVVESALRTPLFALSAIAGAGLALAALVGALALLRLRLLKRREVGQSGTWDCGYAAPTARMQYTGSSFTQPLTSFFASLLRTRRRLAPPRGLFPARASLATRTPDGFTEYFFRPVFKAVERALSKLRGLQAGSVHIYILYIAVTLIVLLIWKLR